MTSIRGIYNSHLLHLIHVENIQENPIQELDGYVKIDEDYQFTSISPTIIQNNDIVEVSFTSTKPSDSDWIGAYSPPDVDIHQVTPVLYGCCTGTCTGSPLNNYLTTGAATLTFNFTNLRAGIKFYYFIGGLTTPTMVTSSFSNQTVNFENINTPLKNRLIATGNPDEYHLLWSTANATTPYMKWGISSNNYSHIVSGSISFVNKSLLCNEPATSIGYRELGSINTATFTGVKELQLLNYNKLYYRFGDEELNLTSSEFTFHLPPLKGTQPSTRPTTLALIADLGVGMTDSSAATRYNPYGTNVWDEACPPAINTTRAVIALVEKEEVDAIIHTGDLAYADGYLSTWDFFLNMISPMAGRVIYLTTEGNHESDAPNSASYYTGNDSGGECGIPSTTLLPLPAPATTNQPWWSYDIGIIHVLGMSTEHNFTIGSPQYLFIENDLKKVNRSITPWILFTGHRPMYVDSNYCCQSGSDVEVMQALQANVEPLLYKYQVNLAFSGHFHDLQRQSAVYQNKTVQHSRKEVNSITGEVTHYYDHPNATVWMLIGAGGNGPNLASQNYSWSEAFWNNRWGYAIVAAVNAKNLSWKLYDSANNNLLDNVIITQDFSRWNESNVVISDVVTSSNDDHFDEIIELSLGIPIVLLFLVLGVIVALYPNYKFWKFGKKKPLANQSEIEIRRSEAV